MTEDEQGKLKASEEKELMGLMIEDFFIKLVLFKERMNKRVEKIKGLRND